MVLAFKLKPILDDLNKYWKSNIKYTFCHAVIFPDLENIDSLTGINRPPEIIGNSYDLDNIEKSKKQTEQQLVMNPVWHVHNGSIPKEDMIMSFSMLLNLVETSNADSKDLLWKFVKKYKSNIQETNFPIFDGLVSYAIKYFNDVIKSQKKYKTPSESEKKALEALIKTLEKCNDQMPPEEIQTLIYSTGKENGYAENLRDWFKLIYEVVFGDENGPRMGFFISFFGVNETKDLIMSKLK